MKKIVPILLLFAVIRMLFIPLFELFPQEAYYYFYAQHPSLSYFDHPPMVALFIKISTTVFGHSVWGLRFGAILFTLATQVLFYKTARLLYDKKTAQTITVVMASTLMVSTISLISTPDIPLVMTWTASLYALIQAVYNGKKGYWLLAGVCMGLAFDSKYTAAILQMGLFAYLILSKRYRGLLKTPYPYATIIIAHVVMSPVYIWNAQNEWASFAFQSTSHTDSLKVTPHFFLALLVTQGVLVGVPLLYLFLRWIFTKGREVAESVKKPLAVFTEKELFLAIFFLPLFLGFFALSFTTLVKPNWIVPAYIAGMLLVAPLVSKKVVKSHMIFGAILHLLVVLYLGFMFYPINSDDTCVGWEALAERVTNEIKSSPELFVFAVDGYKTSAQLRFYSDIEAHGKNVVGKPALHFDYIGVDIDSLVGRDALFIDSSPRKLAPKKRGKIRKDVEDVFASWEELDPLVIQNRFGIQRVFHIYRCRDYRGFK